MIDYLQAPVAHEALFKKYASKKFLKGKSCILPSFSNADMSPASIMARKWAKDYCSTIRGGGGVALEEKVVTQ